MRIALISDLHGVLESAERVLADIAQVGVDQIICLGDVALFGPQPQEVLRLVQALGCPVVMGNTDAWAIDPQPPARPDADSQRYADVEGWGAALLDTADQRFIRTFQPVVSFAADDRTRLLCFHGSPRSYHEQVLATTPDAALEEALAGHDDVALFAGGHTHTPLVRRFRGSLVVNPGSVGLPFQLRVDGSASNPPWAEYALVSGSAGELRVELRRVPVDVARIVADAHTSGMPHAGWWVQDWVQAF
jgi:putative phosphoesterase